MTLRRAAMPLLLLAALAGCGRMQGGSTTWPDAGRTPADGVLDSVPMGAPPGQPISVAAFVANPFEGDPQAVQEGQTLFGAMNCVYCHGPQGSGLMGPSLNNADWRYGGSPAEIYNSIHDGRPKGMPSFGTRLPPDQIWKIVAYLESLGGASAPATAQMAALGPKPLSAGEQAADQQPTAPPAPEPRNASQAGGDPMLAGAFRAQLPPTNGWVAAWPMNFLQTYGPRANPVTALGWGLTALSMAVVVIISLLVVAGIWRRGRRGGDVAAEAPARGPDGLRWIYVGLALTVLALAASLVWTVEVLAEINSPHQRPVVTLDVTGHQWWWEVRYDGSDAFTIANEIHIPVGQPVLVRLHAADVIHSFWIPALTGKTDAIPGRNNVAWLQADRPGTYRGQCAEFCGEQHAHMALYVVADPPQAFAAWRRNQAVEAPPPANAMVSTGGAVFFNRCSACHTIRGTPAGGIVGPDLTHLMSRRTLGAGLLPNNRATLAGWIENPQALKPGARMPPTYVPPTELAALVAYLETLR